MTDRLALLQWLSLAAMLVITLVLISAV